MRSGTLSLFLCSYPIAYAAQSAVVGPSRAALDFAWSLAPASLLGVVAGAVLARVVSERIFRRMGIGIMLLTSVALLASVIAPR